MTEKKKEEGTQEIWTPPETIDANTQRMAWLLFLEWWKEKLNDVGLSETREELVSTAYTCCLEAAKIVRRLEQGEG